MIPHTAGLRILSDCLHHAIFFWVPIEFYDYLLPGRFELSPRILAKKIPRKFFGSSFASNGYITPGMLELTSKVYSQAKISIFCFSSDWFRHSRVVFKCRETNAAELCETKQAIFMCPDSKIGGAQGAFGSPRGLPVRTIGSKICIEFHYIIFNKKVFFEKNYKKIFLKKI